MRLLRSIAAVILGYAVFGISAGLLFQLSGQNPHAKHSALFMALVAIYGMFFAAVAGVIAARIAPQGPVLHAMILSGLIAVGAAVSLATSPATDATWSQWEAIVFMAPCAILAARIAAGSRRR